MTKPDIAAWTSGSGFLVVAWLFIGCGGETTEPRVDPQDGGVTERDAVSEEAAILACREAFAGALGLPPGPVPSFRRDLLPMFSTNCAFGGCHEGDETTGHLRLGYQCTFDPKTMSCNLDESLVTDELVRRIHGNLLSPSENAPTMKRVEPGKIEQSFALFKLSGCQNAFPELTDCTRCGDPMPPITPLREWQPELFRRFATWVAAGAPID